MLEFCEEPYLCRRKVLLNYLDEDFRSKECNNMCDNCVKDLRVAEIDFTDQARIIVSMVECTIRKKIKNPVPENICCIFLTFETFHLEISLLNSE